MILEMMQSNPTSANFADSISFNFEVDELPLDTPTVLGELAGADGMLNTPVNRDARAFNFMKPDLFAANVQLTKAALSGEYGVLIIADNALLCLRKMLINHYCQAIRHGSFPFIERIGGLDFI